MRNIIVLFLLIFSFSKGIGQEVSVDGVYIPNQIRVGEFSTLRVSFISSCFCTIAPGATYIEVTIPPNTIHTVPTAVDVPTGAGAAYFDWFFDGLTWTGTNNQVIPLFANLKIDWSVEGLSVGNSPSVVMFVDLNFGSDPNPNNNNAFAALAVLAPLPIQLSSFTAISNECGKVDLAWETSSEFNNNYIEIQRSKDGRSYTTVGKVKGANQLRGASYSYTDQDELLDGVRYFYRLKQVDFDGKSQTHQVVSVSLNCPSTELAMAIYPNPAAQKTYLTITGATNPGESSVQIINGSGKVVRTLSVQTDVMTEIDLSGLPGGIYQVLSNDLSSPLSKRLIKIN